MFGTIIGLLGSSWLRMAIFGAVVGGVVWIADDYRYKTEQIAVLQDREAGWKKSVKALQGNVASCKAAHVAGKAARESFKVDVEKTCKNWNEVKGSDTPVLDLLEKLKEKSDANK